MRKLVIATGNGYPEADARALQKIADKIVIEGNLPW